LAKSVSIIIPTLSAKTKPYLDLCMQSINNLDYPKESIEIVISSPKGYCPQYPEAITYEHDGPRDFAEAVNLGVKRACPTTSFIFIASDDIIFTKDSLKNMVDNYWRYELPFYAGMTRIPMRFFRRTDIAGLEPEMMNAKSFFGPALLFFESNCFYATMISRSTWNTVGELDARFKTGYEDTDYCKRAAEKGIRCATALNALIWHFGGATSSDYVTDEMRISNVNLFKEKWG